MTICGNQVSFVRQTNKINPDGFKQKRTCATEKTGDKVVWANLNPSAPTCQKSVWLSLCSGGLPLLAGLESMFRWPPATPGSDSRWYKPNTRTSSWPICPKIDFPLGWWRQMAKPESKSLCQRDPIPCLLALKLDWQEEVVRKGWGSKEREGKWAGFPQWKSGIVTKGRKNGWWTRWKSSGPWNHTKAAGFLPMGSGTAKLCARYDS